MLAPPEAAVTPAEQQAVQAIMMGVDPSKAAKSVVDTTQAIQNPSAFLAAQQPYIVTSTVSLKPQAPQNSFAAALENKIGSFSNPQVDIPPVIQPDPSQLTVAELTHQAVQKALRNSAGNIAQSNEAQQAAAPAAPVLAMPIYNEAQLPNDQASLEALATAQAQAEIQAQSG